MSTAQKVMRVGSAIALTLAIALLAGCSTPAQPSKKPVSEPAGASEAPAPTMELVTPADGATVPAGTVKLVVTATNHEFTMASNTNVEGQGHVHFTLDDRPFVMSIEPEFELKDVEPGTHRLVAELVQNNTQPFDPPVEQEIEFVAE